jgi:hypothetical protein
MTAPVKAYLETESGSRISFLFNPETLDVKRNVTWLPNPSPQANAPGLTFDRGQSATMTFDLIMDTTDTGTDVTTYTNQLLDLTKVDAQKQPKRPQWVRLGWGRLNSFKSVVEEVSLSFTFFAANGTPLRARAKLTLKQFEDEGRQPLQNPTSGSPQRDRMHEVKPGETLDRIAYQAYGDSTIWRLIATRNQIADPLRLKAGMRLILPEREAVARGH